MLKKCITVLLLLAILLTLSACGKKTSGSDEDVIPTPAQLDAPSVGDTIAVIETSKGTVKIRLFTDEAIIACENFIKLAESGYYDGCSIHKVIEDFVIQTGDPTDTGSGGESAWGNPFSNEYSDDLHHYVGAVGVANNGEGTNGSQFYIVTGAEVSEDLLKQMKDARYPDPVIKAYKEFGGQPLLDYRYTVFAQVYEGLDVIDKIDSVNTDDLMRPKKNITVKSITILKVEPQQ